MHNSSFHRAREISFVSTNRFEQSLVQVLGKGTVVTQRHSGRSRDILLTSPLRDSGDYRAIQIQRMIKRSRRSVSGASSSASRLFNYIYQVVGSERTRRAARSRVRSSRTLSLSLSLLFRKKKKKKITVAGSSRVRKYDGMRPGARATSTNKRCLLPKVAL